MAAEPTKLESVAGSLGKTKEVISGGVAIASADGSAGEMAAAETASKVGTSEAEVSDAEVSEVGFAAEMDGSG